MIRCSRADVLRLMAAAGVSAVVSGSAARATAPGVMRVRSIPKSGEAIPVIGLGTWQTFDVGDDAAARTPLERVLALLFEQGGKLIDSSPMYGRSESVVGDLLSRQGSRDRTFVATKVWTEGRDEGIAQMESSFKKLRVRTMDLMQIHNLVDWRIHLKTLRAWKDAGRIRYVGITHYTNDALESLTQVIEREAIDFVQMAYSIAVREPESRLLPAAAARGVAVIVNRPFEGSALFQKVRGRAVPDWAAEIDCTSWAQFFLKFIVSHPAVTCAIPGTAKPEHMLDNAAGGVGRLPDAALRKRMIDLIASF